MTDLHPFLTKFDLITLPEMDGVKLLDRTDTKFLFSRDKLPQILETILEDYKILSVNDKLISDYETLYYDTDSFGLYMLHHNGRTNRYKIRYRKYVQSNLHFFEIKFKNNKDRTIKQRIKRPEIEMVLEGKTKRFLESTTNLSADSLDPKFFVNYSRITFVGKKLNERLTIDLNLTFKNPEQSIAFDTLVIAELKQQKAQRNSPFWQTMKKFRIMTNSISKYCFGVTQLYPEVRCNNFKPKLLTLNKIIHDDFRR